MNEFDWDKFQKVIDRSSSICTEASKDIAEAIAAGKGETIEVELIPGGLYQRGDTICAAIKHNGERWTMVWLREGLDNISMDSWKDHEFRPMKSETFKKYWFKNRRYEYINRTLKDLL